MFIIPGNNSMDYAKWIPKLQVTIGNYIITDNLYLVYVSIGIQIVIFYRVAYNEI